MLNDHALLPITRHSNAPCEHVPPSLPTAHTLAPRTAIIRAQGTRRFTRVQEECARWEPATAVACGPRASPLRPRCSTRRARFLPRSAFAHESVTHVRVTRGTSLPTVHTFQHHRSRYGAHPAIAPVATVHIPASFQPLRCTPGIVPVATVHTWASFRSLRRTPGHRRGRYGTHPGIVQAAACRTNEILPTCPILFQRPQVDHLFTIFYTALTWGFINPLIRYRIHFSFLMGKVGKIARRSFDFALQPPETGLRSPLAQQIALRLPYTCTL